MIAGEGIIGILLAICAVIPFRKDFLSDFINISEVINLGNIGALVFFVLLLVSIMFFSIWNPKAKE